MADYVVTLTGKDNLSQTIKQVKGELNTVGQAAKGIDAIGQKFDKIKSSSAPLKKQLKDLQGIMAQMNLKGLSGTEQFTEIAQYAGQLKDAISDASAATKRFADDTFALSAAGDAMQMIAASGSVATGVMGAFGVESDKVQQAILKVQSSLAILNGVQTIANKLNKDSALLQYVKAARLKLATAAQNQQTAATNAGTIAQIKNNLAVLANPYVAAAAAIAALAAAVIYYTSKANEMTDAEKGVKEALETSQKAHLSGLEAYKKTEMELDQLRTTLDKFKGSKEQEKKLVDELNSKYGNSLGKYKDLDSWKKALANTSYYYCKVMQAEAKLAALNAEAYSAWAKAMAGEDVEQNMAKFKALQAYANDALDDVMFYKDQLRIAQNLSGAVVSSGSKTTKSTHTTKTTTNKTENKIDYDTGSLAEYQARLKEINDQLNKKKLSQAEENKLLREAAELEKRIALIGRVRDNIKSGGMTEALKPKLYISLDIDEKEFAKIQNRVQQGLTNLPPTNFELMQKQQELTEKKNKAIEDSFASLKDTMSSLGEISDEPVLNAAGTIAQAIATYILGWSEATAQAAKLGPIGWAAFSLGTAAQLAAIVAQIHSISGYATGGIIGGTSYSGDKLVARVNSGEMVLNKRQQTNLFNAISSGRIGNGGNVVACDFRLRGSDIYGALKNYSAVKGKSGINTGIL